MRSLFLLCALSLSSVGCIHVTAVPSVQGKAFVVKTTPFGGSFWNCDATSGEPTCYKVQEIPASAK
ncbi:MAG TPA: hypothetical protein PKI49_02530 [Pseudomonadota bacterium]|jgi:hypothetical protein|nr:hypothetical protein [Pseudomonadota bacterium]HND10336.1 hypothetical protein [Pseudomonadota bacterium]HNF96303.1 hypothetical protein [Pseudomonadota bacterium]HNK45889.1 hypothetical protein [Pseudomonadota bacterium]HNN51652.1 hypothetical protein [Pseudomonadota bacterium]